jgi:hydroxysqualene dehydroxylase
LYDILLSSKQVKNMSDQSIVIIGGGLSGLSAAVELCASGHKTLVLEQDRHPGGRTYSFTDAATGDLIDNGQHLMMGCYHATRRYMRIIKSEDLALLQPNLHIGFLQPNNSDIHFSCPPLPAPLHMLGGLMRFKGIPLKDRLKMLSVAKQLVYLSHFKEQELDKINVEEWLIKLEQPDLSRKFLWDVINIGALNNRPENVSALMLYRVLRAVFLGKREYSSLIIPRVALSEVLVCPAVNFIKQHGGDVLTGRLVTKFNLQNRNIISVLTKDGTEFFANVFVSTVPWYGLNRLLCGSGLNSESMIKTPSGSICDLDLFKSSSIISIQLWFDQKIMDEEFAALIDTRVQWIFDKKRKISGSINYDTENQQEENKQHLSLVISGAQEFVNMSKEDLLTIVMQDLQRVLPKSKNAKVVHSIVIKEKRATFTPSPGLEEMRPLQRTSISNFFLGGDWTNTGLPASIESAVLSGKKVSELIL